jgi:ankyrin repeat protein
MVRLAESSGLATEEVLDVIVNGDIEDLNEIIDIGALDVSWRAPHKEEVTNVTRTSRRSVSTAVTAFTDRSGISDDDDDDIPMDPGDTFIHLSVAAALDALAKTEVLVKHKCPVNVASEYGFTPLHIAARVGRPAVCEYLLTMGAEVDARDANGCTPLHLAARGGLFEVCLGLIRWGADVDLKNHRGEAVIHLAALGGISRLVKGLVKVGSDMYGKTDYGETLLHYAARGGDRVTMRYVVTLIDTPASQTQGITPCTVDSQNEGQETALHFAAASGNTWMVEMLLEHQADPTLQNEFQETALHRAIRTSPNGEMTGQAARLLVEAKRGLLLQDYQGKTPAHLCEEKGWGKTLHLLENLGAGLQAIPKGPPKTRFATAKA